MKATMTDAEFATFLGDAAPPSDTHTLYRVDHRAEVKRLNADLGLALRDEKYDRKRAKGALTSKQIATKIAALNKAMEADAIEVTYRAMTPDEYEAWAADEKQGRDELLATQVTEPALTADQWHTLGEKLGIGQVHALFEAARTLSESQVVTPGLSAAASAILAGAGSSKN